MTLLHQWANTNVLQCKPVSTLIPCLEHRESAAPATKPQSKSRTCAATPSSQLGRANISALCKGQGAGAPGKTSKHLLILQAFPRRTSLGPSHTPEDAKGFSGSALAQNNNPFWGPAVEMPGGTVHMLCLKSVFCGNHVLSFLCKSALLPFQWQSYYFRSLKEAISAFAHPYMVQASPNSMETLNFLVFSTWWVQCNQRTADKTPGCSFSIPVPQTSRSSDFCNHSASKLLKSCCHISDATFVP